MTHKDAYDCGASLVLLKFAEGNRGDIMGRPYHTKSISSTSTAQLATSAGSSAPSLIPNKTHSVRKFLLRTTGLLAIVSIVTISSAAEPVDNNQASSSDKATQKSSSINLDAGASDDPQKPQDSVANQTTNNTTVTNDGASNSSNSSYSVTVNGQRVAVPENGTNQQIITTPDGSTTSVTIDNSTSNQGTSSNSNTTTTRVNTNTSSGVVNQHTVIERKYGSP